MAARSMEGMLCASSRWPSRERRRSVSARPSASRTPGPPTPLCAEAARRPSLFSLGNVALVAGWCLLAFLVYFVYAHTAVHVGFDPYEILGVDRSATEADIKRVFRVLALRHHPDRNPDSREEAAAQMIRIQSAFNALTGVGHARVAAGGRRVSLPRHSSGRLGRDRRTAPIAPCPADPDARANWDKYGHPDGPGAFRMGIALPEWFLTKDRSRKPLVLAALLLGGITAPLAFLIYLIHRAADPVAPKEERGEGARRGMGREAWDGTVHGVPGAAWGAGACTIPALLAFSAVSPDTVKALLGPPPSRRGRGRRRPPRPARGSRAASRVRPPRRRCSTCWPCRPSCSPSAGRARTAARVSRSQGGPG